MAKKVTWPVKTNIAYHRQRQTVFSHLNTANRAIDRPQHVVVENITFKATTQQTCLHSRRFVNQVRATVCGQGIGIRFLVTRLDIGQLGVCHARCNARWQVIEATHLSASRHQHCLLTTAATHRSRAKIRDKRPRPEYGWVARL